MEKLPPQDATVFAHDGTERPILRPKDNELQKECYSGKQKKHTVNNNVLADENCKVFYLTPTVEEKNTTKS